MLGAGGPEKAAESAASRSGNIHQFRGGTLGAVLTVLGLGRPGLAARLASADEEGWTDVGRKVIG